MRGAFLLLVLNFVGIVFSSDHIFDDVLVAVGNQIDLLTGKQSGHRQLTLESYNASLLVALAYDPTSQELFFSDRKHATGHIFSLNLNDAKSRNGVQAIVEKGSNESVEGLTYDPVDKMLLWTDGQNQSIRRIRIAGDDVAQVTSATDEKASAEVVHFLKGDRPRGLVCDPCTRMLYWTNWNMNRPTIERSHLNGSHREVIVQRDLLMPHGLGLDISQQRIYWANNVRFGSFQIERSFVDGSDRQLVYEGKAHEGRGQFVYGLTVGDDYIYWTDWDSKTVFAYPKEGGRGEPTALSQYKHKPMAVAVLQHQPIDCSILSSSQFHATPQTTVDYPTTQVTLPAYTEGDSVCSGYCWNGGECVFDNDELNCSCPEHFSGERCEIADNSTVVTVKDDDCMPPSSSWETSYNSLFVALISLSAVCVMLMATVMYLVVRVWQLSQLRPRFKRRRLGRISNKMDQQLPLPSSNSGGGHVINIEDCCNMNICETPCMEPPSVMNSRTPSTTDASNGRKSVDRLKLLNCEF